MIAIVDYSMGNVGSIQRMLKKIGEPSMLTRDAADLEAADRLILPGVGAFDAGMGQLENTGVRRVLEDLVLKKKKPLLGICLGMQLLFERSDEGSRAGLGWIHGEVKRFDFRRYPQRLKVPHMGWNQVTPRPGSRLFAELDHLSRFYFVHSYYGVPAHEDDVSADCVYGDTFCCAVSRNSVHGAQFHPEKSHRYGLQLLKTFADI